MVGHNDIRSKWIVLFVAIVLLFNVVRGLTTGSALLSYRTVTQSEDGYLFWTAVCVSAVLGVAALLVGDSVTG